MSLGDIWGGFHIRVTLEVKSIQRQILEKGEGTDEIEGFGSEKSLSDMTVGARQPMEWDEEGPTQAH